jgi:Pyruvate/2-oxoacid:ferredoxin oxidoreductase delta subunit/bacterioferritin-associated ferredoxin
MTRLVVAQAEIDLSKCNMCGTCWSICPTEAIKWEPGSYPERNLEFCYGCGACIERCPAYAVTLKPLPEPRIIKTDVSKVDYERVKEICIKAGHHPKEIICFCTGTRAEEVAAAVILGARTPEDISRMTGVRTGCRVECIQPILRILKAAGIEPKPKPGRHAWYGITPTIFEIPKEVKEKYSSRGFYFKNDEELFKKILKEAERYKEGGD